MDEIVAFLDPVLFGNIPERICTPLGSQCEEGSLLRQIITLYALLTISGYVLYFLVASTLYGLFYKLFKEKYHPDSEPQPYKGQVQDEIRMSVSAIPIMSALSVPFFLGEIRGYAMVYDGLLDRGWVYAIFSTIWFIAFSDFLIYWFHRWEHDSKWAYINLHKQHHNFKAATPFASHAFHPLDGWGQSIPYQIFPFLFPISKWLLVFLFFIINVWTVSIHDGVDWADPFGIINGTAHHYFHHMKFNYNYGQYFTLWDRLFGTHMNPFYEYDKETKTWGPSKYATSIHKTGLLSQKKQN